MAAVETVAATVEDSAVEGIAYSTGRSGSKLKWLPAQTDPVHVDSAVTQAAYTSATPRPARIAQNQPTRALKPPVDPFGSRRAPPAPASRLSDELPAIPEEPKATGPEPRPSAEEPAAAEKTYVAPEGLTPSATMAPADAAPKRSSIEHEFVARQRDIKEECPSSKDLKPIRELTTDIVPSEGELPHDCPLGDAKFQPRSFAPITYTWMASGLCHKPLYFEDVQLERYGHMAGPWLQPFASGANFFLTLPILPYKMGLEPPNECMYALGYYRPGDCAPYLFDPLPLSVRAAFFEAGAWVGGAYLIP